MRSTIRAGGMDTLVGVLLAVPLLGVGLAAFIYAAEPRLGWWPTALCRALGVSAVAAAVVFTRMLARPGPRLRVQVAHDTIRFRQHGQPAAKFWREDIEMIVIERCPEHTTYSLSVYGPERSVLDAWQTGWIGKPRPRVIRGLKHHSYPYAFRQGLPRPRPPAEFWVGNDRRRPRPPRQATIKGHRCPGTAAP